MKTYQVEVTFTYIIKAENEDRAISAIDAAIYCSALPYNSHCDAEDFEATHKEIQYQLGSEEAYSIGVFVEKEPFYRCSAKEV